MSFYAQKPNVRLPVGTVRDAARWARVERVISELLEAAFVARPYP
jgi:hypothetical protein